MSQKTFPRNAHEFAIKKAAERGIEKLDNRRDKEINKLNQEICILIAELNEQMVYNVQQANSDSVRQFLKQDIESKFLYTMETAGFAMNFSHTVSNTMGEKLRHIEKKQARIEQIIVETQIAHNALDGMMNFQ